MKKILLKKFFQPVKSGSFQVDFWDGTTEQYGEGKPSIKITFKENLPYKKIVRDPLLALGEAFMEGAIELSGDIEEIIKLVNSNKDVFQKQRLINIEKMLAFWPKFTSLNKQKQDIQNHYDLGNEFFSLWLDETMSYSCAYFKNQSDSLHQAQIQKIDYVLKKLQLHPGETLLDIGCGWGWLIIRATQKYGVKAMGITLSQEQYQESRRRIKELNLEDQVKVDLIDYRMLSEKGRTFDKIASIGMFEHVGQANYLHYMQTIHKLLKNGGLSLLHTITDITEGPVNSWITKHIFPGGYIPSLREIIWLLPEYDFHVLDVESLRLHYAMTLDRWTEGFEKNVAKVREMYGERFVRMWQLYLRSSAASFRASGLNIHQILFSKGLNNHHFTTRDYLYN